MIAEMTTPGFHRWLNSAKPNDTTVYYTGDLIAARHEGFVIGVATAAMDAYKAGRVFLTQRRIGEGEFEYIATASSSN